MAVGHRRRRWGLKAVVATALVTLPLTPLVPGAPASADVACTSPDTTWTAGDNSSDWTDVNNWDNGVPGVGDAACIENASFFPELTTTTSIGLIDMNSGASLSIIGGSLTTDGGTFTHLEMSGPAQLTLNGTSHITGTAVLSQGTISGSGDLTLEPTGELGIGNSTTKELALPFVNDGVITWYDGNINANGASIINNGTFDVQAAGDSLAGSSTLENSGTFAVNSAGSVNIDLASVENKSTGLMTLASGTTNVNSSTTFTNGGVLNIDTAAFVKSSGTLAISGAAAAVHMTSATSALTTGTINVSGSGTFDMRGSIAANVNQSGGTATVATTGNGTANLTGNFAQTGGELRLTASGSATPGTDYDRFAVTGTATLSSGGTFGVVTGGYNPSNNTVLTPLTSTGTRSGTPTVTKDLADPKYYEVGGTTNNLTLTVHTYGSVTGTTFYDDDGDGVLNGSDTIAPSRDVFLDKNNNGTADAGEQTTSSDVTTAVYDFGDVPVGVYDIVVDNLLSGESQSTVLDSIVVGNGATVSEDVGLFGEASIAGTVFADKDGNGTYDNDDYGIENVQVYIDLDKNGSLDSGDEPEMLTDSDGVYQFDNLGPLDAPYRVRATAPTSGVLTSTLPTDVAVTSNGTASDVNFGYDVFGSIAGNVYVDTNGNGLKAGGETTGPTGVTVWADLNHDSEIDSDEPEVVTTTNGAYLLEDLPAGTYDVKAEIPDGYTQTSTALSAVVVGVNQDVTAKHIGVFADNTVSGMVFEDKDGNGTQDSGEGPAPFMFVYNDVNNDGTYDDGEATGFTEDDGTYVVEGVGLGIAHIRLDDYEGILTPTTTNPLNVNVNVSGATTTNINFGVTIPAGFFGADDPISQGTGYWFVGPDGSVAGFGEAVDLGSPENVNAPVVGLTPTPTGNGYFLVGADGGVYAYGDATFQGSHGGQPLNEPIVGITTTSSGEGYFLVGADGGVFAYGDAVFAGSTGGQPLNAPVVGIATVPGGEGYFLVGADGGVFAYGDATFQGSRGGQPLNAPVVGIATSPGGTGYWLASADGGVFTYGDAQYFGSMGGQPLNAPITSIKALGDGTGYWLFAEDGGIFAFGAAGYLGNPND